MTKHISEKFIFDKDATRKTYEKLDLKFNDNNLRDYCLTKILEAIQRTSLDVGIDYTKPWEEISMQDHYQIEYIFVGKIESKNDTNVSDNHIGINVFEEKMFGQKEFESEDLLNLTLIIDK